MTLNSYAELQPVHAPSDIQESILIITDSTTEATQLAAQLAEKGYHTVSMPLFSVLDNTMPEHLALFVVVNCQGACCQLNKNLRLINKETTIPVICLNDLHNRGRRSNMGSLKLRGLLTMTSALDAHRRPLQTVISEPSATTQERRHFERRKSIRLMPIVDSAEAGTLEPDDTVIHLSIVSERDKQINKLAAQFSDIPTLNVDSTGFKDIGMIPQKLASLHPDLLLVDTAFTNGALTEWLRVIRQTDATVKIILLYNDERPCLMKEIVEFGISGIIKTDAGPDLIKKAIRTVHQGELWLPHHLMSQIISHFSTQSKLLKSHPHFDLPGMINASLLTQREISITQQVARGLTNKEIAKSLDVSPETIKKHLKNIFEKSGVHTRSQLAAIYSSSPIIEPLP
ncbi:MAG: response regulator transcription factor [Methylicorpusculum sp.]|uniref:response regulator transcription factor n=1 Tax=Methylicorpusculum sp. TaxID=2713644 RepID=UPI00271D4E62|nr:response regulator transcription factor [Methylicorpusculum sp.]MDO8938801.1 response regulator transcription factor [Methylicorpusculum sp.]MDO9241645.1 response regulator transcription factor [Methylicorpusculum sp.]MDP2202851.1 response regulator transcription factor [Methylicorpusculum sp.]